MSPQPNPLALYGPLKWQVQGLGFDVFDDSESSKAKNQR